MKKLCTTLGLAAAIVCGGTASSYAEEVYETEIRMYQVLTNISGDTSQTLPCTTGDIVHEIDQALDGVTLTMKGGHLSWNDAPEPNHPLIVPSGSMRLIMSKSNPVGSLVARSETQYFHTPDGDRWVLATSEASPGIEFEMRLTPDAHTDGVVANDYRFEFAYIKERTPLRGVTLDVGKPTIDSIVSKGTWRLRLGEWSCLFAQVPSKGRLYVFSRTTLGEQDASDEHKR